MSVLLKDIAKVAGVSPQVVSAVLNNKSYTRISQERRKKIWKIAEDLGYRANLQAKSLRIGKSAAVGVFLPDWKDLPLLEFLKGVAIGSDKNSIPYRSFFGCSLESYCQFIDLMTTSKNTGIISYNLTWYDNYPEIRERLQLFINNGGKVILIKSQTKNIVGATYLDVDDYKGGELASAFILKQRNFKNYFIIGFDSPTNKKRSLGFYKNIEEKRTKSIIFSSTDIPSTQEISNTISQQLECIKLPVAFFSESNLFTASILYNCAKRNWKYGEDYILVSYDINSKGGDCENIKRIIQPFETLGTLAFDHIHAMLINKKVEKVLIDPYII